MEQQVTKKRRKKKSKAYRQACIIVNLIFLVAMVVLVIVGLLHTFTKKRDYREKGISLYEAGNYTEAITYFDKALSCDQWFSDKLNVDIEFYLADSYIKIDDYKAANSIYRSIPEKYSDRYYNKAQLQYMVNLTDKLILFAEGDYPNSMDTLIQAVSDGYTELALYVALIYEKSEDYDNMKKYYDIYNASLGLNSYLALKYTEYYLDMKDYNTALGYARQGINLEDKEYVKELYYLEIVSSIRLTRFEEAYDLAVAYAKMYPGDTNAQDICSFLETRININEEPINDKFDLY